MHVLVVCMITWDAFSRDMLHVSGALLGMQLSELAPLGIATLASSFVHIHNKMHCCPFARSNYMLLVAVSTSVVFCTFRNWECRVRILWLFRQSNTARGYIFRSRVACLHSEY